MKRKDKGKEPKDKSKWKSTISKRFLLNSRKATRQDKKERKMVEDYCEKDK